MTSSSKYPDLSDIDYVKPLSKTSKNVDKYFKNSTFCELKDKLEHLKNYQYNYYKDMNLEKDAKMPTEKKEANFFVKLELKKLEKNIIKRMEQRDSKLRDIKKRRFQDKYEENNSIFPGKYTLNYDAVSKKVKTVIIKNRTNFRRDFSEQADKEDFSLNKTSKQQNNKTDILDKKGVNSSMENEENKSHSDNDSQNEENNEERKQREKEEEERKKKTQKKKVDSVESLKWINSFGNIKKGIKFEMYSFRNNDLFGGGGGGGGGDNKNNRSNSSLNRSMIENNNSNMNSSKDIFHKIDNRGSMVNNINRNDLGNNYSKHVSRVNSLLIPDFSNTSMKKNSFLDGKNFGKDKFRKIKLKTNPQLNFKNMSGRESKVIKVNNFPDGLTYKPKYDYTRPNNKLILPFNRKPDFYNKQFLMKKMWTSYNNTKNMKMLEIEAYLKDQENIHKQRNNHYKENTLEFKGDF